MQQTASWSKEVVVSKVIIVVRDGFVESVFTRRKDIEIEIIDFDTYGTTSAEERRLSELENSNSYIDILKEVCHEDANIDVKHSR